MSGPEPDLSPPEQVKDVILLSVDSLRRDRLHKDHNGASLMPRVEKLASDAIEFETGVSPGPSTPDSVPAILTGAYPSQFPGYHLPPAGSEPRTLAERLGDYGFSSAAFHQNNLITRRYNIDRGFDYYYDISEETREETGRGTWRLRVRNLIEETRIMDVTRWAQSQALERFGRSLYVTDEPGDSLTDRALNWLDTTDDKRFLWLHYMDTHHPYLPPDEIQKQFGRIIPEHRLLKLSRIARSNPDQLNDTDVQDLEYAYDCATRFVDTQIGRVLDYLSAEGRRDEAMIVVTADHGEEFMEHGSFGHRKALWDELVTVPLIIDHPDRPGRTVPGMGPVQSLADTIVEGGGLFDHLEDGVDSVVCETSQGRDGIRCCRTTEYKLIVEDSEHTVNSLTDSEQIVEDSEVPNVVLSALNSQLEETREAFVDDPEINDEKLQEDLAALGYLDE